LKLQGKRNEAVVEYRRAASLRPDNTEALKELFFAGSFDDQHQLFERRLATGGVEAFMALGEEIARLQDALRRLAEKLPDLQAEAAVPLAGYDRFRRLYDVPPAPAPLCPCRFAMILPARETALDTLYAQLAAIRAQSYPDWRLCVIGGDPESRRAVERASASDPRIAWIEATSGESIAAAERRITLSLDEDWLLFLAEGAQLHRRALEWALPPRHGASPAPMSPMPKPSPPPTDTPGVRRRYCGRSSISTRCSKPTRSARRSRSSARLMPGWPGSS
jgi:hypothetical protein